MRSRLDRVTNWDAIAVKGEFQLKGMAKACGVSERQLRRYFQKSFGVNPKVWIDEKRLKLAIQFLSKGDLVKEASAGAKFKQASHFSKFFTRLRGCRPADFDNSACA